MNCPPNPGCCQQNSCETPIFNQPQLQIIGYPIFYNQVSSLMSLPANKLPTAFGVSLAFTPDEFSTGKREKVYPSQYLIRGMY